MFSLLTCRPLICHVCRMVITLMGNWRHGQCHRHQQDDDAPRTRKLAPARGHGSHYIISSSQVLKTNPAVGVPYKFHTLEIPPGVFAWWKCNNSAPHQVVLCALIIPLNIYNATRKKPLKQCKSSLFHSCFFFFISFFVDSSALGSRFRISTRKKRLQTSQSLEQYVSSLRTPLL